MCVLVYKPENVSLPSLRLLQAMQKANKDGCGVATMQGVFRTTNFDDFLNVLNYVDESEPAMLHFRWATHGSVCTENCHPFANNGIYFAHNGILANVHPKDDKTDSETYFQRLAPLVSKYGVNSRYVKRSVNSVIGCSKFCVFDSRRKETATFGEFFEFEGCYYSNLRFMYSLKF